MLSTKRGAVCDWMESLRLNDDEEARSMASSQEQAVWLAKELATAEYDLTIGGTTEAKQPWVLLAFFGKLKEAKDDIDDFLHEWPGFRCLLEKAATKRWPPAATEQLVQPVRQQHHVANPRIAQALALLQNSAAAKPLVASANAAASSIVPLSTQSASTKKLKRKG